jgi:hypothetical protein
VLLLTAFPVFGPQLYEYSREKQERIKKLKDLDKLKLNTFEDKLITE